MENKEIRLQALRVLNENFKHESKLGCLEDRQIKLVLDAMVEFRQLDIKSVCEHTDYLEVTNEIIKCKCGKEWFSAD